MKKIILLAAAALCLFSLPASLSAEPDKGKYQSVPFLSEGSLTPEVLMVLSKDHKMFQQAYNPIIDFDGDGFIDTGFNPSVVYYGYFDPYSCYQYSITNLDTLDRNGSSSAYFKRVGPTIDDETETEIENNRPSAVPKYIPSPRAVHHANSKQAGEKIGVCQMPSRTGGGKFSGNWLNFLTTSRFDVIRKVLYGGLRQRQSSTNSAEKLTGDDSVILEASMVPNDAHAWGYDVLSDERWAAETPQSVYYDISKYTPFAKPTSETHSTGGRNPTSHIHHSAHFFARTRTFTRDTNNEFPIFRYVLNANQDYFNLRGGSWEFAMSSKEGRYWDWSLNEWPNPNDDFLTSGNGGAQSKVRGMTVRVEACNKKNFSETEGCKEYPDGSLKPVGLLQQYGEGDKMHFGLLTGSHAADTRNDKSDYRRRGGVMRHHIDKVSKAVNPATGAIIKNGLIWTLDMQKITGESDRNADTAGYSSPASWGSPIGEMLFEGVRYMAVLEAPSGDYLPSSEIAVNSLGNPGILGANDWKKENRPNLGGTEDCSKPVIMLISDLDNDFDGDNFSNSGDLKQAALDGVDLPNFSVAEYLKRITTNELNQPDGTLKSGKKYIYAKDYKDPCDPKTLSSLADVKGICPNHGAFEGSYSAAAVAYFAKTHNFMKSGQAVKQPVSIDTYAISLATAFPELVFPLRNSSGEVEKQISVLPRSTSRRGASTTNDRYLGFINYFILNWETDKDGDPFRISIVVNYEDAVQGNDRDFGNSDWDMDVLVKYTMELVSTNSAAAKGRTVTIPRNSSDHALSQGTYYTFKNPDNMNSRDEMIDVKPDQVAGLVITSSRTRFAASISMTMGYYVSGSTTDGNKLPLGINPEKPSADGAEIVQSFKFADTATASGEFLRNPMWMAAKYGGFTDRVGNGHKTGVPDPGEWEGADGVTPKNYFQPANIAELPDNLEQAFEAIARGTSTGTATSASVNSILGGGISIQTLFYPEYTDRLDGDNKINWVGSVFGLFVDKWGNLREDTNGDRVLTTKNGRPGDPGYPQGDLIINFEDGVVGPDIVRYADQQGNNVVLAEYDTLKNFQEIKPVWNLSQTLAENDVDDRNVFYGRPDPSESNGVKLTAFDVSQAAALQPYLIHSNTAAMLPVPRGADLSTKLIEYILGTDQPDWRPRRVTNPWKNVDDPCDPADSNDDNCITWRLGDVINSKPVIVGAPALNYDLLYKDKTYYDFKMDSAKRRSMAYFGANDGMLHAVNLGFYGSLKDGQVGYKVAPDNGSFGSDDIPLGTEMWAYIPTSVLPHLQWLADPEYSHSYYVDLNPVIQDIRTSTGEWKTILIGGLRLGGREIESTAETPFAYSEIFALDITDPELREPELLWRYSSKELGMSVGLPTVVSRGDDWYVVAASGPTLNLDDPRSPYDGNSDQTARLIVLNPETGVKIREILVTEPADGRSFFTDSFLPMAELPTVSNPSDSRTPWSHKTIYYGLTVSRDQASCLDTGSVYRLDMRGELATWELKKLIDTDRPVTGAVNAAYDAKGNLWVVFGTGRVWGADDLRPCVNVAGSSFEAACDTNHEQYLYGIKEELDDVTGEMTFRDRTADTLADFSGAKVFTCFSGSSGGYVTNLLETATQTGEDFPVGTMCDNTAKQGTQYNVLSAVMMGDKFAGYKRKLDTAAILRESGEPSEPHYEMIVTQPKIQGLSGGRSIMGFTSFVPPQGTCGDSGQSNMYMLDTFTGLPAPYTYDVFAGYFEGNPSVTEDGQVVGYREVGGGKSTEAVFITMDNKIILRTSAQDGTIKDLELTDALAPASGIISWREATDTGFTLDDTVMSEELEAEDEDEDEDE